MFFGETKRLVRVVLVELKTVNDRIILMREEVMAEIGALRQAITDELAQLRGGLTQETENLRAELEAALDRADASDEAKEEALGALDDYKSRIEGLTGEISAEGIFGEADVTIPENPDEEEENPPHPELPIEEPVLEEPEDEGDAGPEQSGYFFTR